MQLRHFVYGRYYSSGYEDYETLARDPHETFIQQVIFNELEALLPERYDEDARLLIPLPGRPDWVYVFVYPSTPGDKDGRPVVRYQCVQLSEDELVRLAWSPWLLDKQLYKGVYKDYILDANKEPLKKTTPESSEPIVSPALIFDLRRVKEVREPLQADLNRLYKILNKGNESSLYLDASKVDTHVGKALLSAFLRKRYNEQPDQRIGVAFHLPELPKGDRYSIVRLAVAKDVAIPSYGGAINRWQLFNSHTTIGDLHKYQVPESNLITAGSNAASSSNENKLKKLQQREADIEVEISNLNAELHEKGRTINNLLDEKSSLESKLEILQTELDEKVTALSNSKGQKAGHDTSLREIEDKYKKRIEFYENSVENYKATITGILEKNEQLNHSLSQHEQQITEKQSIIEKLLVWEKTFTGQNPDSVLDLIASLKRKTVAIGENVGRVANEYHQGSSEIVYEGAYNSGEGQSAGIISPSPGANRKKTSLMVPVFIALLSLLLGAAGGYWGGVAFNNVTPNNASQALVVSIAEAAEIELDGQTEEDSLKMLVEKIGALKIEAKRFVELSKLAEEHQLLNDREIERALKDYNTLRARHQSATSSTDTKNAQLNELVTALTDVESQLIKPEGRIDIGTIIPKTVSFFNVADETISGLVADLANARDSVDTFKEVNEGLVEQNGNLNDEKKRLEDSAQFITSLHFQALAVSPLVAPLGENTSKGFSITPDCSQNNKLSVTGGILITGNKEGDVQRFQQFFSKYVNATEKSKCSFDFLGDE